jgi:hypothetical protein
VRRSIVFDTYMNFWYKQLRIGIHRGLFASFQTNTIRVIYFPPIDLVPDCPGSPTLFCSHLTIKRIISGTFLKRSCGGGE